MAMTDKARELSKFNNYIFMNNNHGSNNYNNFIGYPIYFNNTYEIGYVTLGKNNNDIQIIYSTKNTSYSMLEWYFHVKYGPDIAYKDFIINQIKTTINFNNNSARIK
uniref:hypothetical protein n=1 Tax=Daedaleopsis nitida TaxID=1140402 RepID=UPI0030E1DD7D